MQSTDGPEEELALGSTRPPRLTRRTAVLITVAAALIVAAGWYGLRASHASVVTYAGSRVDNAAAVIARADESFASYARKRSATVSARSRCYFDRVGGDAPTDVGSSVFCGPVLLYQGSPPALYLRYALSPSASTGDGRVTLLVATNPDPGGPVSPPARAHLLRPDRRTAPRGADGLTAPGPPPAPADLLLVVARDDVPAIAAAPKTAVMGGRNIRLELTASGFVAHYGRGAATQSAPVGQRLLAFEIHITDGELPYADFQDPSPVVDLSVDGRAGRPLPLDIPAQENGQTDAIRYVIAAVPAQVRTVDLVVTEADVTQRLSVLTGRPAEGNVEILQRSFADRLFDVRASGSVVATVSVQGRTFTDTLPVELQTEYLGYFSLTGAGHAGASTRALLTVSVCFRSRERLNGEPGLCFGFGADVLSIKPDGGLPIRSHDYAGYSAFDVPATFTSGVLTISGAGTFQGLTMRIIRPMSFRLALRH